MPTKKIAFKDYKINEKSPAVGLTMEALNISREKAIKIMRELHYKLDFPVRRKKKKHTTWYHKNIISEKPGNYPGFCFNILQYLTLEPSHNFFLDFTLINMYYREWDYFFYFQALAYQFYLLHSKEILSY